MALFQKNPFDSNEKKPLYTLGLNKTVLIVGLGNMGRQYAATRHNIGFACVDVLRDKLDLSDWTEKKDLRSYEASGTVNGARVILIKPTTMMNLSGEAIQKVCHFYKIPTQEIVVVHDELDVKFGQIRTRVGGSAAGNNGIKSAIQHIGEDFGRVRIGIGPKKPAQMDSADFVLAKFSDKEQKQIPHLLKESTAILTEYIHSGSLPSETRTFLV